MYCLQWYWGIHEVKLGLYALLGFYQDVDYCILRFVQELYYFEQ